MEKLFSDKLSEIDWNENKKIAKGWKLLACAVLKSACIDLGSRYLETSDADFYKELSGTEDCDYKKQCERHDRKLKQAIAHHRNTKKVSGFHCLDFKNEVINNAEKK